MHKFNILSTDMQSYYCAPAWFVHVLMFKLGLTVFRSAPLVYKSQNRQGVPGYDDDTYSPYMQERAQEWDMKIHDPGTYITYMYIAYA